MRTTPAFNAAMAGCQLVAAAPPALLVAAGLQASPHADPRVPLQLLAIAAGIIAWGLMQLLMLRLIQRLAPLLPGHYNRTNAMGLRWMAQAFHLELGMWLLRPVWQQFTCLPILRLAGLRAGPGTVVSAHALIQEPALVSIGAHSVVGSGAIVVGHLVARGVLRIGRVRIGDEVTIGGKCMIYPDVEIGDRAVILPGSAVVSGTRVPARGVWGGNPATDRRAPAGPLSAAG